MNDDRSIDSLLYGLLALRHSYEKWDTNCGQPHVLDLYTPTDAIIIEGSAIVLDDQQILSPEVTQGDNR